ncbi:MULTISPECIES: glycosyl hydrolase [unclassified Paenibacillus]|uniref:glycosyl hydrolase n=1 Tax=unclassified Paenibacillus TaxID=185978 RepID=UPI0003FBB9C5|nr:MULTISPECIES: glycosyl hydrolase [unclassified Paenibacillus]KGP80657.1 beta-galactosidase [Paenibacillus sp. MAEPY2]KGP88466.1 beta-galactosidase [Paenibacillus sp. MAEPY1]
MNVKSEITDIHKLLQQFKNPEATYRPQPFWFLNHKFIKAELESQIQSMHEAGVGGVVLHARHGMQTPYLSEEFLDTLEFCTKECEKRDMMVWLYDEDNWPSGTLGGKLTRQHPEYRMRYLRVEERRYLHKAQRGTLPLDFVSYDNNELIAILVYRAIQQDGEWLIFDQPEDITALYGQEWKPDTDDDYIILACWSCEIAEGITFAKGYYLDTLNPEAVQAFIQLAYEPFQQLQSHFGATIQGVFTDEPGLMIHDGFFGVEAIRTSVQDVNATLPGMVFAWTHGMAERYQQENGYELIPCLGALLYGMADGNRSVRQDYYDTITRWYVEGYHAAIRTWCESHSLLYIGHTLEEPVWGQARSQGNQTRVLQQFHYAGVDYLTHGIGTRENPHRIVSVKTAASVAQLNGKKRVICESFGASGHAYAMRQRRLDANFMAFLGVNLFIPHAFYYSFAGYRKTDFPPTEFKHAPHWPHYRAFADYLGRLSVLGASTKRTPEVLLLSPIHTVYEHMFVSGESNQHPTADQLFSLLSDRMLRSSIDYDYVDECQLREVKNAHADRYPYAGNLNAYSILILPEITVMSSDIAEQLVSFVNNGGTLIAVGAIPRDSEILRQDPEILKPMNVLFGSSPQHGKLQAVGKGHSLFYSINNTAHEDEGVEEEAEEDPHHNDTLMKFCVQLRELMTVQPTIAWTQVEGHAEDLISVERKFEVHVYTWLMNWSEQPVSIQFDPIRMNGYMEEWDLENGSVNPLSHDAVLSLVPGELRVLSVRYDQATDSFDPDDHRFSLPQEHVKGKAQCSTEVMVLGDYWQFQTVEPNVLVLDQWQVTLNDRKSRMNAAMPGQVNTYRTTFVVTEKWIELMNSQKGSEHANESGEERRFIKMELILDEIEQKIPSHIGFLQRRRNVEIFVNGVRMEALRPSPWQDIHYNGVDISKYLVKGENELEVLTVSLLEPMPAISFPAYLIGLFVIEDQTTLTVESEQLAGVWNAAGYPFYSGAASYSQQVDLSNVSLNPADELWLEAEDIRETARLYVNGEDAGIRLWPPYHWNVTSYILPGINVIDIQVGNTLENVYGKSSQPSGMNGSVKLVARTLK